MKKAIYKLTAIVLAGMMLVACGTNNQNAQRIYTSAKIKNIITIGNRLEYYHLPEIKMVTITATGDCTLGAVHTHSYEGSFHAYYDSYGETYFFEKVRHVFENDDLTIINLECVLTDSTARVEKTFNLKGKESYTGIMTSSSVEACSLGNNHTKDYGQESLSDTKAALDAAGIVYAYNDIVSYFTTDDGIKVGLVSASVLSSTQAYEDYLLDGVAEAKANGADLVVAMCHWGIERDYYPTTYQQNLAHELIDAGADLIIGNHPHVLQGVEEYKGKIICYSLGNFSFGGNKNPSDKNTAIYQQTFVFIDGKLVTDIDAKIYPCRLSGHTGYNDFQPVILEGNQATNIIKKMNTYSAPYSGVSFVEDGTLILTEE